jgi:hypothetical protein
MPLIAKISSEGAGGFRCDPFDDERGIRLYQCVQPGGGRPVEVEAYFRGTSPSREEFDRMLRDFRLDVTEQGSEVRVDATFQRGWKPLSFPIFFIGHSICRNGRCLEYSAWLREVEYRIRVPFQFSVDVATSGGPISVDGLKGEVNAHTSGGSLHFNHIDGPVTGRTSGGCITLAGVKGRTTVHIGRFGACL